MKELTTVHTEKDLFYYLQKLRLLTAKNVNDEKIENSKNVKESALFVSRLFLMGQFFCEHAIFFHSYATIIS